MTEQANPNPEQARAEAIINAGKLLIIGNPRVNPITLSPDLQTLYNNYHRESTIKTSSEIMSANSHVRKICLDERTAYDKGILEVFSLMMAEGHRSPLTTTSLIESLTKTQSDIILLKAGLIKGDEDFKLMLDGKEAAYNWVLGHKPLPDRYQKPPMSPINPRS